MNSRERNPNQTEHESEEMPRQIVGTAVNGLNPGLF